MAYASGKLRHRVRIDQLVDVLDSSGEPVRDEQGASVRDWEEVATVWAAIEPLSVREFIQSAAMQSQTSARIVIRYRSGLDAAMRLVHLVDGADFRIYNPAGFLADAQSGLEYLTIPVGEGVNPGQ